MGPAFLSSLQHLFFFLPKRAMPAPTPAAVASFAQIILRKNPIALFYVVVYPFFQWLCLG